MPGRTALSALPSRGARALAFVAILVGGLCGWLIGYGFARVLRYSQAASAFWALVAAVGAAVGTAVIAVLGLRAMGEWRQLSDETV
jgi:hypothetical protein